MVKEGILKKTEKGEEEMRSRKYGLAPNLRRVLILVDGKSDPAEILAKGAGWPDILPCLEELERHGYIHHVEGSLTIAVVKEELVRIAQQVLGDDAAKVIEKIREAPDTKQGLEAAASKCKKFVKLAIDEKMAEELMGKCAALLARLS